jgi:hypothetical protein
MMTLKERELYVKREAKKRNLKIRVDKRLNKTPYRAMQPFAAIELKQPFIKKYITYAPYLKKRKRTLIMDIHHEILEYDKMKKKWRYRKAHSFANRKQRSFPC